MQYIGLAADEEERLLRKGTRNHVSLLNKYGICEQEANEICKKNGLLSPIYEFTNRGGCFFCPNAKEQELRHLYDYHKELWEEMLKLERLPNKATELFNRDFRLSDIDAGFRLDDAQISIFDFINERG